MRRDRRTLIRCRSTWSIPGWLRRLVTSSQGQDVVEYALLTAFFGVVAVATWIAIRNSLGTAYTSYDSGTQGLWEPPGPSGP
jgi:Flp pilus assembly pilin Flp